MKKPIKKEKSFSLKGDHGDDLFIIKKGTVKIYREDQDGKEVILIVFRRLGIILEKWPSSSSDSSVRPMLAQWNEVLCTHCEAPILLKFLKRDLTLPLIY